MWGTLKGLQRIDRKGEGMRTHNPSRQDWTVVQRRQPVRIVQCRAESGYTGKFGIVCCDCGDDPDLDAPQD